MTLSGSRGVVRVSRNLACETQAAMVAEPSLKEPDFYREVTGERYPGEYGERASARRRGSKFENNVMKNDAALLRRAVASTFGYADPDALVVRNFEAETGGPHRLVRVRRLFSELAAGKDVPHILLQPHLRLPVGPELRDFATIYPDLLVFDPRRQMYLPGELKSFIVRGNVADPPDLELARRQAAVQVLALRAEAARVGLDDRVLDDAVFIFALPFGIAPAPAVVEPLPAEVYEVARALERIREARAHVTALRTAEPGATLADLAAEFRNNYRDNCVGSCILASVCERGHVGEARTLGDAVGVAVGLDTSIERIAALADGATPLTTDEMLLAPRLRDAALALGRPA